MQTMDLDTLQIIALAAGVLSLIALGLAAWAAAQARRKGASDLAQRYETLDRELQTLKEHHRIMDDRVGRYDRTHQDLRQEIAGVREDLAKTDSEQQEQIFELREEHKVVMQRDDRLERTLQEVQAELNAHRDGRRVTP